MLPARMAPGAGLAPSAGSPGILVFALISR
jgi:hypothetical protein